jgi:hypothetical protein
MIRERTFGRRKNQAADRSDRRLIDYALSMAMATIDPFT